MASHASDVAAEAEGDEEALLWQSMRSDGSALARERLFARYAPFARSVGRRLCRARMYGDIDHADVDQSAYEGLMQALDRFDPTRGVPFKGYAAPRISGAVIDGIAKMSDIREQISWRHRMRRERIRSLQASVNDSDPIEQALEALTEIAVGLAVGFMLEGTALYQDEDVSKQPNAYDSLAWKGMKAALRTGLESLPERERAIICHHYLDGMAFENIARLFGMSKGRISQLHRAALQRLQRGLRTNGHFRLEQ